MIQVLLKMKRMLARTPKVLSLVSSSLWKFLIENNSGNGGYTRHANSSHSLKSFFLLYCSLSAAVLKFSTTTDSDRFIIITNTTTSGGSGDVTTNL